MDMLRWHNPDLLEDTALATAVKVTVLTVVVTRPHHTIKTKWDTILRDPLTRRDPIIVRRIRIRRTTVLRCNTLLMDVTRTIQSM